MVHQLVRKKVPKVGGLMQNTNFKEVEMYMCTAGQFLMFCAVRSPDSIPAIQFSQWI